LAGALRTAEILDNPHAQQGGYRNVTFARVAEALARSGEWDEAVKRARRCDDWGRAYAIADVIRIRAEAGDLDGAIRQAERLENTAVPRPQAGGPPFPSPRRMAIVKLVGVLAEKKELDRANRLLDAHPDAMAEGLAAIARVRLKAGDSDGATVAARRLLDRGGDWQSEAIARVVLVRALIVKNRLDEAVKVADGPWKEPEPVRQHSLGGSVSVEPLRGRALVALARARIERGDLDAGLAAVAKVPRGLSRAFDLLGLARERLDQGDRTTAAKLADAARAAMDGPGGSEFYLADVASVMARCGNVEEARRLFRRALFARDIGTPINRSYAAINQAQGGDIEGALRTIAAIPEVEPRDQARLRLAVHHAREGRADAALDVAGAIEDRAIRATATAQVGMILSRRGDRARGAAACRSAVEMVESPTPEVARDLAHAWAAIPGEAGVAVEWARRRPKPEVRAEALFGAAWGLSGQSFWMSGPSRYVILDPITGQQGYTSGDVDL
jgi:tetratricopeptide (TPR) repeat protein